MTHMERNGDLIRAAHLMTMMEAAESLGVTRQRVHQMIKEGKIDYYLYGKRKMIHRHELERFIMKRKAS